MNNKDLMFGLSSLEADAAIEALERRERGLPQHPESPLSEKELTELAALDGELGPEFIDRQTDLLLRAVKKEAVPTADTRPGAEAVAAAGGAGKGASAGAEVVPLRPRPTQQGSRPFGIRRALYAAVPLAAAASLGLFLFPFDRTDGRFAAPELAANTNRATVTASTDGGPLRVSREDCINIKVPLQKSAAGLSAQVVANAYLIGEGRPPVRWPIELQLDASGALSTSACQSLPAEAVEGPQELRVLIGAAGRLLLYRSKAVQTAAQECEPTYGIQCVRRSLLIGPSAGPSP